MLRVEHVHVIRHKVLVEGMSIRAVARELRISRNTVKKYLEESEPRRREASSRPHPVRGQVESRAAELLSDPRLTGGKQRWTAPRLREVLDDEGLHASKGEVNLMDVAMMVASVAADIARLDAPERDRLETVFNEARLARRGADLTWTPVWRPSTKTRPDRTAKGRNRSRKKNQSPQSR